MIVDVCLEQRPRDASVVACDQACLLQRAMSSDTVLLGAVRRLRRALSQPTAKAIHAAIVAEGGVRYQIADGIAEVGQVSLAAVKTRARAPSARTS